MGRKKYRRAARAPYCPKSRTEIDQEAINQAPSLAKPEMTVVIQRDLLRFIWISNFPNLSLEPLMKAYIKRQLIMSVAVCLAFVWWMSFLWNIFGFKKWCQIRRVVKWNAYFKAAVLITKAYATLLVVNTRYISVVIIPIIVLVFIGALFVVVTPNGSLKSDEDDHNEASKRKATAPKEDGNAYNDNLFAIAVLPCWMLCCLGHFNVDNLVVSQFLLFLTSTLGELTLMMARLPSEVAPAFEVIRRASLVVALLTAHTMAAEMLADDDILLACTPELITGLLWFSIHFGHGGSATISVDKVTSQKAAIFFLGVSMSILACLAPSMDGPEGETDLLSRYTSVLVACAFSIILPSLCVFALEQWPTKTVAAPLSELKDVKTMAAPSSELKDVKTMAGPSSELMGAIKLLSFCRNILFMAATASLVFMPLVNARLRLQVQQLSAEILNKFMDSCLKWFFNAHWNPYLGPVKVP